MSHYLSDIGFPKTKSQWDCVARRFYKSSGLLNVAGAIDGTLIQIHRIKNHEGFYDRKGRTSLNVQVICDGDMRYVSP